MHKLMQFFYRFSLYFTAVIAGILLAMSMVCMYGYKEYLSGGNYALGNVAVILLAVALGVLLVMLYRKMQGTGQKATVILFLSIILLQIDFWYSYRIRCQSATRHAFRMKRCRW